MHSDIGRGEQLTCKKPAAGLLNCRSDPFFRFAERGREGPGLVAIIISCPVVAVVRQQTQTQRSQSFEWTAGMRAVLESAGALRDETSGGPWHGAPLADTGGPCPPPYSNHDVP